MAIYVIHTQTLCTQRIKELTKKKGNCSIQLCESHKSSERNQTWATNQN